LNGTERIYSSDRRRVGTTGKKKAKGGGGKGKESQKTPIGTTGSRGAPSQSWTKEKKRESALKLARKEKRGQVKIPTMQGNLHLGGTNESLRGKQVR